MEINNRIKMIRKELKLTQKEFGKQIAVAQTYLSDIEIGARPATDKIIKLICLTYNVSETWLRTGSGNMFKKNNDSLLQQVLFEYKLDDFQTKMIEKFVQLDDQRRKIISNYIKSLIEENPDT